MRKRRFLKDIKEREKVEDLFLVTKKESGVSKSGKSYLNLKLMDRSGELEARVWDRVEDISAGFKKGDFVIVRGFAVAYQGNIQINATTVESISPSDVNITDFLPASKRDLDEMLQSLESIISGIKDMHLQALLISVFRDESIRELFKRAPAAKSMHHNYIGGLIEHALSLCSLVREVSEHYEGINQDLLTAGAILHDIGKIYELSYERSFDYTDEGRLLGHITIGINLLDEKIREIPDFPGELAMLLKHMLLSHHGHLEFGSPKRPKTVEAVILYYCDDLDSKIQSMQAHIASEPDSDSRWTSYHRLYNRYIHKGYLPDKNVEREGTEQGGAGVAKKEEQREEPDLFNQRNL